MKTTHQSGFGHIALVLVVLVFGAIGAIGYTLYANPSNSGTGKTDNPSTAKRVNETTLNVPAAPQIKTASDLDRAIEVLNKVDPGSDGKSDDVAVDKELSNL
jgi:hypothetical protein